MALSILDFGGVGDGVISNDQAFLRALAAIPMTGGCIYFPAGKYKFDNLVSYSLVIGAESGRTGLTIKGDGPGATKLYWPNAAGGLALVQTNANQALTVSDISFVTGCANGGTALQLTANGGYGPTPAQSSIQNVTFQGSDGGGPGSYFWTKSIDVIAWPCINFYNVNCNGSKQQGVGIRLSGLSESYYGVLYNLESCFFNYNDVGLIYDGYVQGVTVSQSNFNAGNWGIRSPAGALGTLAQLKVSDSQFDNKLHQIFTETAVGNTQVSGCIFFVKDGFSGVHMPKSFFPQIANNWFGGTGPNSGAQGVHIAGSPLAGTVTGNIFHALSIAGVLEASTSGLVVATNSYHGNSTNILNQAGSANTVGA